MLKQRQTSNTIVDPGDKSRRVNLLNWDGKGAANDLFPPRADEPPGSSEVADPHEAGDVDPRP
jgi:nitrate reductase beta subunit